MTEAIKKRRRWMTSFSIRTSLIVVTIIGIWLGLHYRSVRRQEASVASLREHGYGVWYGWTEGEFAPEPHWSQPVETWLRATLGKDHIDDVLSVYPMSKRAMDAAETEALLSHLPAFPHLRSLALGKVVISDDGLQELSELRSLGNLEVYSDVDRERLAAALPECEVEVLDPQNDKMWWIDFTGY